EIYFIPYKNCDGRKLLAKGKLISKYYSIRKEFKALGVIQTKIQSESDDSGDDSKLNENLQAKLKFLEENIEPWPTVVEYWTDTSKHRITELHEKSRVVNRNKGSNKGKASVKGKFKSNVAKLQSFVEERPKKLTNWGLTVQPYVLACGSSVEDIDAYYVIVDTETKFITHKFTCQSSVRVLNLCFKVIHAAHLEYSAESYRLWRLIQKELYELTTVFDEWKCDAQLPKLFQKLSRK
ncbi:hypothetical protein ALC57_00384, partial [Trachymyrmex cornetzi]